MKKYLKKIIAIILSVLVIMMCGMTCLAYMPDNIATFAMARSKTFTHSPIAVNSTSWKTVAKSTDGLDCHIKISSTGASITYVSVRMLDKNGSEVWYEKEAFGSLGSREFWCGSDIYTVQVKYVVGGGSISCYCTD